MNQVEHLKHQVTTKRDTLETCTFQATGDTQEAIKQLENLLSAGDPEISPGDSLPPNSCHSRLQSSFDISPRLGSLAPIAKVSRK